MTDPALIEAINNVAEAVKMLGGTIVVIAFLLLVFK